MMSAEIIEIQVESNQIKLGGEAVEEYLRDILREYLPKDEYIDKAAQKRWIKE